MRATSDLYATAEAPDTPDSASTRRQPSETIATETPPDPAFQRPTIESSFKTSHEFFAVPQLATPPHDVSLSGHRSA